SKYINIDTATPNVTISSLSSNVTGTGGQPIRIAVTATASISGIDTTKIQAWHDGPTGSTNSSKVDLTLSSGKYVGTLTAPTAAGFYLITVNVSDMAGNYNSSVQKTFSVDSSIPTINANTSNNTYVSNLSTVTFTIGNASYTSYNTTNNNNTVISGQNATSTSAVNIVINASASAAMEISISANNTEGVITNASYKYLVDNVVPSVVFSGLTYGQVVNGTTTLTATSSDADSGLASVKFYIAAVGSSLALKKTDSVSPYTYDWDTVNYADGNYTVNITSTDYVGNVNSNTTNVIVNNSKPTVGTVSSGFVDFGGTIIQHVVPLITGLNSTTAKVVVNKNPFKLATTIGTSPIYYMNITADTPSTATVYFKIATSDLSSAYTSNVRVSMDHNGDGIFSESVQATYTGLSGDYYNFYFTTTQFSIFALSLVVPSDSNNGGGGGGGSSSAVYPIAFTSTGTTVGLKVNDRATFSFDGISYSVKATKVSADSVTLSVLPTGKTVAIDKGKSADVDLNGDGSTDLLLKLDYTISSNKAFVEISNANKAATTVTKSALIQYANNWVQGTITKAQLITYANSWAKGG
ncbi:MAG: hypothetical protein KKC75_02280, partial [Nanoarchaeota archaeon]|nr:hypothetical protein [Nanoarchaeota archaeon]